MWKNTTTGIEEGSKRCHLNKYEWWHEYLVDVVAWCAIWNMLKTIPYLSSCETYMVLLLAVDIALSVALLAYIYFIAKEMEMIEG